MTNLTIDPDYEVVKNEILKDYVESESILSLENEQMLSLLPTYPQNCQNDAKSDVRLPIAQQEGQNSHGNSLDTSFPDKKGSGFCSLDETFYCHEDGSKTVDDKYCQLLNEPTKVDNENLPSNGTKPSSAIWTTFDIIRHFNVLFIILADGILSFQYYQIELLVNMVGVLHFEMTKKELGTTLFIAVLIASVITILIERGSGSNSVVIFYQYVSTFILVVLEELILFAITGSNFTTSIASILLGSTIFFNMMQGCFSGLCCKWLLFAITPSHSASTVESHRYFIESVASSLAFATSGLVFTNLFLVIPFLVITFFAIVFSLLIIQEDIFHEIRKNEKSDTRSHKEGPREMV
ncbi:uncharacterized protein [Clytia hemisphaerica]|uniref:uncharacterized protein n=1 Tax=Clytia hemisphaerica TaxID=252671 RepID=UPI0034D4A0ED